MPKLYKYVKQRASNFIFLNTLKHFAFENEISTTIFSIFILLSNE